MASIAEHYLLQYLGKIPIDKLREIVRNDVSVIDRYRDYLRKNHSIALSMVKPEHIDYDRLVLLVSKNRPEIAKIVTKRWLMREVQKAKEMLSQ